MQIEETTMEDTSFLSPKFFKVLMPASTALQKLRIPGKFVQKHGHELSNVVRLSDPIGRAWYVCLENEGNNLWFHNGWGKFIEDQCINYGYFLVFEYNGDSNFYVNVFDLTATEVEYPLNKNSSCNRENLKSKEEPGDEDSLEILESFQGKPVIPSKMEDQSDDDSIKILASFPTKPVASSIKATRKHGVLDEIDAAKASKFQRCPVTRSRVKIEYEAGLAVKTEKHSGKGSKFQRRYQTRSKVKIEDGESGINIENLNASGHGKSNESHTFRPILEKSSKHKNPAVKNVQEAIHSADDNQNPSFTVTLKPYNLSHKMLAIPDSFFGKNLPSSPEHVELQGSDGKKKLARVNLRNGKVWCLSKGWGDFVDEKNLQVGDTCLFELLEFNKPVFMVSTFRNGSEIPKKK